MLQCHFCGAAMTLGEPIGREATCESCGRDLRCCLQCRHYDTHYNNDCTETMADPVVDKDRRNFCEYFYFNRAPFTGGGSGVDRKADARSKLEGLFKPSTPPPDRTADARSKLEDLFRKKPPDD